jgi:drug/metabolite transporter (DMT)-like permease
LTNLLLWAAAFASAGIAFYLVLQRGWRLAVAMLPATAVGTLLSVPVLLAVPPDRRSPYLQVELVANGSVCLILAGVGAAIAYAIRESRRSES